MTVKVTWVGWLKPRTTVRWAKFPELSSVVTAVANRTSSCVSVPKNFTSFFIGKTVGITSHGFHLRFCFHFVFLSLDFGTSLYRRPRPVSR
jgi:hypothetical protein